MFPSSTFCLSTGCTEPQTGIGLMTQLVYIHEVLVFFIKYMKMKL